MRISAKNRKDVSYAYIIFKETVLNSEVTRVLVKLMFKNQVHFYKSLGKICAGIFFGKKHTRFEARLKKT